MWECRKCHERHRDSFDTCWKCGTARGGAEDPAFRPDVDLAGAQENALAAGDLVCPKCGSRDVIPGVRIVDRGDGNFKRDLQVEICENPAAWLFKGTHAGALAAAICGACGHVELSVANPQELLEIYRRIRPGPG